MMIDDKLWFPTAIESEYFFFVQENCHKRSLECCQSVYINSAIIFHRHQLDELNLLIIIITRILSIKFFHLINSVNYSK